MKPICNMVNLSFLAVDQPAQPRTISPTRRRVVCIIDEYTENFLKRTVIKVRKKIMARYFFEATKYSFSDLPANILLPPSSLGIWIICITFEINGF